MTFCVKKKFDKNYKHNFHGLFWERTAAMNSQDIPDALEDTEIFSSTISEASDDSNKDKAYNPQVTGNNQSDTDSDSKYGKSGYSWKIKQVLGYFSIYYFCKLNLEIPIFF